MLNKGGCMISFQFEPKAKVNFGLPKGEEPQQSNNTEISSSSSFSVQPPSIHSMVNCVYCMGWLVLAGGANAAGSILNAGIGWLTKSIEFIQPSTEANSYLSLVTTILGGISLLTSYAGTAASAGVTAYCIYNAGHHLYEASKEDFFEKKNPVNPN